MLRLSKNNNINININNNNNNKYSMRLANVCAQETKWERGGRKGGTARLSASSPVHDEHFRQACMQRGVGGERGVVVVAKAHAHVRFGVVSRRPH